MRRRLDELTPVDDEDWVLRLIHPQSFDHDAPDGEQVKSSALEKKELKATDTSYGPSMFAEAKLEHGLATLELADPRWGHKGIARVQVKQLRKLGVDVVWSPEDCDKLVVKGAHVSLVGCDPGKRDAVVDLFAANLWRKPVRSPKS